MGFRGLYFTVKILRVAVRRRLGAVHPVYKVIFHVRFFLIQEQNDQRKNVRMYYKMVFFVFF